MLKRAWKVFSRPHWSDGGVVSYRIDRVARMLWLAEWVLWTAGLFTVFAGPFGLGLTVLVVGVVVGAGAKHRLRTEVRRLEMLGATDELESARKVLDVHQRLMKRIYEFGARRCEVTADKFEARAIRKTGSPREAQAASRLRSKADRERRWARKYYDEAARYS